jgi:glycosyltransferase involved in cell wall biosynthesis
MLFSGRQLLDDAAPDHARGTASPDGARVSVVSMGPSEASVSVVVPALNEERHLGHLLRDIESQTRAPHEVIVVDAGSHDDTVAVARGFASARVLHGERPVARGRNLGGKRASGDVVVFIDADTRLPEEFLERFVEDFLRRDLDVGCPLYVPHDSTPAVERFHRAFNLLTMTFQGILPSGAGICLAVKGGLFRRSRGFDPTLKFDDIELIRRLSREGRFGIVEEKVLVSDRRYREHGVARAILEYSLMALFFALGRFEWANSLPYEFGKHAS